LDQITDFLAEELRRKHKGYLCWPIQVKVELYESGAVAQLFNLAKQLMSLITQFRETAERDDPQTPAHTMIKQVLPKICLCFALLFKPLVLTPMIVPSLDLLSNNSSSEETKLLI